ncbi:pollen-specific leucine-rich repeat extensin-like protein 2 [Cinnamomum micranthum f. kanehirae]|uniref:Pollen-specific leucine-rich repeat extensin-like protein 2 n=1 Tax=Cinnamomum micranthum f. kanehirae TaxID=337451 RepID=A0A3S3R8D8_9MAGN|nr:pollen-specific leucine-rich repeat extensin-like protein 2 [Cinnamomum micranthum f. kanehirae]
MNSDPVIHEISSDEEGCWNEEGDASHDWIWDLLDDADSEGEGSDDVVILDDGDSCASTMQKDCVAVDAIGGHLGSDSDDDCLVLDGDPDNPVSVVDEAGNGSDDLLVVGEKGQLACRDYPHPRHLCAKFPFSTTPHAKHCNLCHCYVCDSLAPCMYWGSGVSLADHCNSTDKEEVWRTQRQNSKQRIEAGPPVQRLPDTTLSMRVPLHNITQPPHSSSEPLSIRLSPRQSSVSEPIKLHASATSFGTTACSRPNPHFRFIRSRYPQSPSGSIRLIPRTHTNTRGRGGISALGPQFVPPQSRFKGAGPSGSSAFTVLKRSGQGSFDGNRIYTVLQPKSQSMQATPGEDIHLKKLQNLLYGIDSELDTFLSTSGHNSNSNVTDNQSYSVSSLPQVQVHDQSLPQFEPNQNMNQFVNSAPNATEPDPSGFNYSWPLNVASESKPVDPTLSSVHPSEALTVMHSEGQHLQNLGSLEFHEENWMYNPMEHQPPTPETASNSMVSDLDFLSVQSPSTDSLFYGFESSWVI